MATSFPLPRGREGRLKQFIPLLSLKNNKSQWNIRVATVSTGSLLLLAQVRCYRKADDARVDFTFGTITSVTSRAALTLTANTDARLRPSPLLRS
ncbi:MAG: hypothetical protein LBN06_01715 [Prevotellaceae bacterium]|nr:hypothetical protein [Prevotellaceae bacterium]